MQSGFKAMIFDMDGTLLDSMFYWRSIWREYVNEHGLVMPEELKDKVICGCGKACDFIARDNNLDRPALYAAMLEEMLARHYRTDVYPKPFAPEMLRKFKQAGYPVMVATATPRNPQPRPKGSTKKGSMTIFIMPPRDRPTEAARA